MTKENQGELFELLELLRGAGVRRATFSEGQCLLEVEFGGEPEPVATEASSTLPADDAINVEDYEAALRQLRVRRFEKKGDA